MDSKIASIISAVKEELKMKQKQKDNVITKNMSETTKIFKRLLVVDCLLLTAILNRSTKVELKRIQIKSREVMSIWLEMFEENGSEGEYLEVANDCKYLNDRYDWLIHILGV